MLLWLLLPQSQQSSENHKAILKIFSSYTTVKDRGGRIEVAAGLSAIGGEKDFEVLKEWMRKETPTGVASYNADVQASAVYAILKIVNRLVIAVN